MPEAGSPRSALHGSKLAVGVFVDRSAAPKASNYLRSIGARCGWNKQDNRRKPKNDLGPFP